jgi:hypothetical protein
MYFWIMFTPSGKTLNKLKGQRCVEHSDWNFEPEDHQLSVVSDEAPACDANVMISIPSLTSSVVTLGKSFYFSCQIC